MADEFPRGITGSKERKGGLTQSSLTVHFVSDAKRPSKSGSFIRGFDPDPLRWDDTFSAILSKIGFEAIVPTACCMEKTGRPLSWVGDALVSSLHDGGGTQTNFGYTNPVVQPIVPKSFGSEPLPIRNDVEGFFERDQSRGTQRDHESPRPVEGEDVRPASAQNQFHFGRRFDGSAVVWLDDSGCPGRIQSQETSSSQLPSAGLLRRRHARHDSWHASTRGYSSGVGVHSIQPSVPGQTSDIYESKESHGSGESGRGVLRQEIYPFSRGRKGWIRGRCQNDIASSFEGDRASVSHVSKTGQMAGWADHLSTAGLEISAPICCRSSTETETERGRASTDALEVQGLFLSRLRNHSETAATGRLAVLQGSSQRRTGYPRTQRRPAFGPDSHNPLYGECNAFRTRDVGLRSGELVPQTLSDRSVAKSSVDDVEARSLHVAGETVECGPTKCSETSSGLSSSKTIPEGPNPNQKTEDSVIFDEVVEMEPNLPLGNCPKIHRFAVFSG